MRLGDYELGDLIGKGGMGAVHRGRAPDGRLVAVKVLADASPELVERFQRERKFLAELGEAQGFVPLLDAGEGPRGPFFVMPLVPGGTLRARLAKGALPIEEVLDLGRALAKALAAAHARGIVHRDVKPENVLFDAAGRPLVADLGLAKRFAGDAGSLSGTRVMAGTLGYAAPEQLDDARSVGPAADVFSLGAVLSECLTGEAPFGRGGVLEVLERLRAGAAAPIARLRPETPRRLVATIERALAVDPAARFPDGAALARALEEAPARLSRGKLLVGGAVSGVVVVAGVALSSGEKPRVLEPPASRPPVRQGRPASPPEMPSADVRELVERARALKARGDDEGAEEAAGRALERAPGLVEALLLRAAVRSNRKDYGGAREDAARVIQREPTNALAWRIHGTARFFLFEVAESIADETRAIELEPDAPLAWTLRGMGHLALAHYREADADLQRAVALDPRLAIAWGNLAAAKFGLGDDEGSRVAAERALALNPREARAWASRGRVRFKHGELAGAREDMTRAIELDPVADFLLIRGLIALALGDRAAARADYDAAIARQPETGRTKNGEELRAGLGGR